MNNSLACKLISTGRLQNNVSFFNSEIFLMKKCHKTLLILLLIFKYFILNKHRIQSNLGGWFLRTSLLSLISYLVEKAFYRLRPWVLGLLNIFPPLVPASHFNTMCKIWYTYSCKSFCWHTGGNDILKNVFRFLYILM